METLLALLVTREDTVYPKKYAHGFCFAVLCCGYTLTDFPISIRLTSLALWQTNDCPSASKATLMNKDKYFMRSHYGRLNNHNKAKHNKTVRIFFGIYCNTPVTGGPHRRTSNILHDPWRSCWPNRWVVHGWCHVIIMAHKLGLCGRFCNLIAIRILTDIIYGQWPLLLTWFNFNPSMDM